MKKTLAIIMCALLVGGTAVSLAGCGSGSGQTGSTTSEDEFQEYKDRWTYGTETADTPDSPDKSGMSQSESSVISDSAKKEVSEKLTAFSCRLFTDICKESSEGKNVLISPLSLYSALSMCLNGAEGNTRTEMTEVLSTCYNFGEDGTIYEPHDVLEREQLNAYFYNYMLGLETEGESHTKLSTANSIWLNADRSDIIFGDEFLAAGKNCYGAELRSEPFNAAAADSINGWVSEKTDGMINKIVESDDMTYDLISVLLNAVSFDGEWEEPYEESDIRKDTFTCYDGTEQTAEFMCSNEYRYIDSGNAVGFIKDYQADIYPQYQNTDEGEGEQATVCYAYKSRFSFVALLPNEEVGIDKYISEFSYSDLSEAVQNAEYADVHARLPKFDFDYYVNAVSYLEGFGMKDAFSAEKADFSSLGKSSNPDSRIYISDIRHKTKITVDENGTKAAAVTAILMTENAVAVAESEYYEVILDRPFVFAIYDNYENIPVFVGTVKTLNQTQN